MQNWSGRSAGSGLWGGRRGGPPRWEDSEGVGRATHGQRKPTPAGAGGR